jgi:hypothetical protein
VVPIPTGEDFSLSLKGHIDAQQIGWQIPLDVFNIRLNEKVL